MSFTFKKYSVLKKNKNFQTVYRMGKSFVSKSAVLYVLPNNNNSRRIGFAVGKKLGGAVIRNRTKRLMRESYRLNQARLKTGIDLVFVARKPFVKAGAAFVNKAFIDLCSRSGILIK